jgi:membrane protein DedA with SNARE-associated domain
MPYPQFLAANASGALCWAGGTTALVYFIGVAAERWLSRFSWIGLVLVVVGGVTVALILRKRTERAIGQLQAEEAGGEPAGG